MNDNYLLGWKPWLVTAEELEKLQAKDRTAIDSFYFRNLGLFTARAANYYKSRGYFKYLYTVDDMLQEAYLHMYHSLNFDSVQNFLFHTEYILLLCLIFPACHIHP